METPRFLPRDRDDKYGQSFDTVFKAEEMDILTSAPRAPRMNAHCERVIGSIRREALDAHHQPATVHDLNTRRLQRTRVLGGVINEYRYAT